MAQIIPSRISLGWNLRHFLKKDNQQAIVSNHPLHPCLKDEQCHQQWYSGELTTTLPAWIPKSVLINNLTKRRPRLQRIMLDLHLLFTQQVADLLSNQSSKTGNSDILIPSTWQTWIATAQLIITHTISKTLIEMSFPCRLFGGCARRTIFGGKWDAIKMKDRYSNHRLLSYMHWRLRLSCSIWARYVQLAIPIWYGWCAGYFL